MHSSRPDPFRIPRLLFYVPCLLLLWVIGSTGCRSEKSGSPSAATPSASAAASTPPSATTPRAPTIPSGPTEGVLADIRARKVLRVGVEDDAPPLNYIDPLTGARAGFDYELIKEVAASIGIGKVDVTERKFEELPDLLKDKSVDLIMSGQTADPQQKSIQWSRPYLEYGLCMIVKQGNSRIQRYEDLVGMRIGIYKGDPVPEDFVKAHLPCAKGVVKEDGTGWFRILENGTVDAIIYDYPFAVAEIKRAHGLVVRQLNLTNSEYVIGMRANNPDLVAELNGALEAFKKTQAYDNLVMKYLATTSLEPAPLPAGANQYVVKAGDSLASIAVSQLGSADEWRRIYDLNRSRVANPHLIYQGQILQMP